MRTEKNHLLLHEKNLYKAFLILALPVFGVNMLKSLNELVDTYFVGQMSGSVAAQAGMSISWPLMDILLAFQVGLAVAGVAVISQFLGAGKMREAKKYAGLLIALSIIFGIMINGILYAIAPGVMELMGATGGTYEASVTYVRIRSFEMVFTFIFAAFQAIRQAQGDTVTPVLLSGTGIIINIILTGILIHVFEMGVMGAALATVTGHILITPFCLWFLFGQKGELQLKRSEIQFDKQRIYKLFYIAAPSAGSQAFASFGFLFLQAFVLDYGDEVAAAFSIGNKVANLLLLPVMALGAVLAAYVGQNVGFGNRERAFQSYRVSRNLGLLISIGGCLLLYPVRGYILGMLTNDIKTLEIAMEYVFWVLLTQPLMSLFQNYMSVFNGSGNTGYSFLISSVRLWIIRLPMILFFKNFTDMGRIGIWFAMVFSNLLIVLYGMYLFKKIKFEPKIKGMED